MSARIGTHPAQTRRDFSGTVDREGGRLEIPTLGGGSQAAAGPDVPGRAVAGKDVAL